MKKIEENNTLVFICDVKANKRQIKEALKKLYDVDCVKINTLIRWVISQNTTWFYIETGVGANIGDAQARWIKEGFCAVNAGCRCIRYCGDEVSNCLGGDWGPWLRHGYNSLGFCSGHISHPAFRDRPMSENLILAHVVFEDILCFPHLYHGRLRIRRFDHSIGLHPVNLVKHPLLKSIISLHLFPHSPLHHVYHTVLPLPTLLEIHYPFRTRSQPQTTPPFTIPHPPSSSLNVSTHLHSHPRTSPHNSACTSPPHSSASPQRFYSPPRISSSRYRRGCGQLERRALATPPSKHRAGEGGV